MGVLAAIATLVVAVQVPAGAADDPKAPGALTALEILERCDSFHFFYQDVHMQVTSILKDADGNVTKMAFDVREKGIKRLVQFHEPPDVAGMAVLVKDEDTIYVYEPEFNKVRRIASHAKKQTMLGSDYTFDDMATKKLAPHYEPSLVSEDEHDAVLWLEQKPGKDKAWPTIRLYIDKDEHFLARKIQYFDEAGKKRKTELRKKLKHNDGHWVPTVVSLTDHVKKHSTTNIVKKAKYDQGLPDTIFSKRYLIREE
jgi:outer membrane lipoprotein-sorting protein